MKEFLIKKSRKGSLGSIWEVFKSLTKELALSPICTEESL